MDIMHYVITIIVFGISYLVQGSQNLTQCYGQFFSGLLCGGSSYISVQSALYGVSRCVGSEVGQCCPGNDSNECRVNVQEHSPEYYKAIVKACNGRKWCGHLRAGWIVAHQCSGHPATDYIILYFKCEQLVLPHIKRFNNHLNDLERVPGNTHESSKGRETTPAIMMETTITSEPINLTKYNDDNDDITADQSGSSTSEGVTLGIVSAVLLLFLIVCLSACIFSKSMRICPEMHCSQCCQGLSIPCSRQGSQIDLNRLKFQETNSIYENKAFYSDLSQGSAPSKTSPSDLSVVHPAGPYLGAEIVPTPVDAIHLAKAASINDLRVAGLFYQDSKKRRSKSMDSLCLDHTNSGKFSAPGMCKYLPSEDLTQDENSDGDYDVIPARKLPSLPNTPTMSCTRRLQSEKTHEETSDKEKPLNDLSIFDQISEISSLSENHYDNIQFGNCSKENESRSESLTDALDENICSNSQNSSVVPREESLKDAPDENMRSKSQICSLVPRQIYSSESYESFNFHLNNSEPTRFQGQHNPVFEQDSLTKVQKDSKDHENIYTNL